MANFQYRISSKTINDKAEVLMRFYAGRGLDQRAHTRVYVPINMWNEKKQRVMATTRYGGVDGADAANLQEQLDHIEHEVLERFITDVNAMSPGWLQATIDEILGKDGEKQKTLTLADEIRAFAQEHSSLGTAKGIRSLAANIDAFCADTRQSPLLKDASAIMLVKYAEYLRGTNAPNTIAGKLRKLRAVFNYAVKKGDIAVSPFSANGIQVPPEHYATPTFLTIPERDVVWNMIGLPEHLVKQRDIFIFQCHTGMRVGDLQSLTQDNVCDGYLQYVPKKTDGERVETVRVPLTDVAMQILDRYKGGQRILPFISTQKYNEAIHDIVRLAGIDRNVVVLEKGTGRPVLRPIYEVASSHIARRTFAANVYKRTNGNQRVTASMTGHAPNSRAFLRYTQVDDEMKKDALALTES